MRPEPEMIPVLMDAANALEGSQKRLFMAETVRAVGRGGQRWALEHLGWWPDIIPEGMHELDSGMTCVDALSARRRKPAEAQLTRPPTTSGTSPMARIRQTRSSRPSGSPFASVPPRSDAG